MALRVAALIIAAVQGLAAVAAAQEDARLIRAVKNRDVAVVRTLLAQNVDVNGLDVDGTPALHWAVRLNSAEMVRLLLQAGANVKARSRHGLTPLTLAAANGSVSMSRVLVEAGADPNESDPAGETILMLAARSGTPDAIATLLDLGARIDAHDQNFEQTALMVAVRENYPAVVKLLVDRGANVNAKTRVGKTPNWVRPNSEGFSYGVGISRGGLPERGSRPPIPGGLSPLLYAARDGRLEIVQILVAAKADLNQPDANGITPLIMAISNNYVNVARFLIDRGADIHASDWYGRTALWSALETRNMDVDNATMVNSIDRPPLLDLIRVLLEKGADPNVRTKEVTPIRRSFLRITGSLSWVDFTGQTPFLTAALAGDVTIMRLLLKYGADPHTPTYAGTTALMAAAGVNWVFDQTYDEGPQALLDAVKLCYELGLDVNAVNSMGVRAIHGAANRGSDDIVAFLVEKGAKLDVKDNEGRLPMTWAEGVLLATNPPKRKPSTIALLEKLRER